MTRWVSLRCWAASFAVGAALALGALPATAQIPAPTPLLAKDHPVAWWFAFKFNAHTAPDTAIAPDQRPCPFGGTAQPYKGFSQEFAIATSEDDALKAGHGLLGTNSADPLGATFQEIYTTDLHYVVWNDQFYRDPAITGCGDSCSGPWGHSKGVVAWNDAGEGLVLQVTTPSWPASASAQHPRGHDGNTLGCVKDNDVLSSQHFFALRLTHEDLIKVLQALANASVVTNPFDPQLVNNGGPADVQAAVARLGRKSASGMVLKTQLSSGVILVSKPSALNVPPWQMLSAVLGGVPLRAATWWTKPAIPSTTTAAEPGCWSSTLGIPGPVQIATSGTWNNKPIGLTGGVGTDFNHAKIGVSLEPKRPYVVFGDLNQQGALSGKCTSSQNGRGGLFYVLEDSRLAADLTALTQPPRASARPQGKTSHRHPPKRG